MMKYRIFILGVICFVITGMFSGCGKKEVDYGIDKPGANGNTENTEDQLAQFKDTEKWKDEWKVTDATGAERTLMVNAKVVAPDLDNMSVIEGERLGKDSDFKKSFFKNLYVGNDVYYNDEEHQTKAEIEERIANLEEVLKEPLEAEEKRQIEQILEEEHTKLETASEDYIVAEEFDSGHVYIGYQGDIMLRTIYSPNYVWVEPTEGEYIGPETLRDYDKVTRMEEYIENSEDALSNECSFSMEDAKKLADSFLNSIGYGSQICTGENQIMWHGEKFDENDKVTGENYAVYGYVFTYGTGVGGVAFHEFPDFNEFDVYHSEEGSYELMFNGDETTIIVTDKGIVEMTMQEPVVIIGTSSDTVKLLPMDTIKNIMKNELLKNGKKYNFDGDQTFNKLQLMYYRVNSETGSDTFSYIPVWCLSRQIDDSYYMHPVFVNAIDGNIIYL